MKKVVVLIAISLFNIGFGFAESDPELKEEITQKMQIDLSGITLGKYQDDFVNVQFRIFDGTIYVLDIQGSQNELKQLVIDQLNEIHVHTPYSESEVHNFKFTFKKQ
ncbi:MAG: hypothetical protein AB8B56_02150 [Crocinitomicaceae bacterium]